MFAVGRLIGRGISTVSGPFTPFSGAVDIVVVEQPDGSFKSSPWYVRFGKFQGVLKTREKVVSICVNGVEADFHMYLDHTGEAYFLEEVEEEIELGSSISGQLIDPLSIPAKSLSCNFDSEGSVIARSDSVSSESSVSTATGSKRSRLLGLVWSRKSSQGESSPEISRVTSLDRAEIVADLLDVNWSTELATEKPKPLSQLSEYAGSSDQCNEHDDIQTESNIASSSAAVSFANEEGSFESRVVPQSNGLMHESKAKFTKSYTRYYSMQNPSDSSSAIDDSTYLEQTAIIEESCGTGLVKGDEVGNCHMISSLVDTILEKEVDEISKAENHEDDQFIFSDDELTPNEELKTSLSASSSTEKETDTLATIEDKHLSSTHASLTYTEMDHLVDEQKKLEDLLEKEQLKTFFPLDINDFQDANTEFDERLVESLPNLWSHIDSLEADHQPRHSFDASTTSPRWLNLRSNILSRKKPVVDIEVNLDEGQLTVTADAPSETPKSDSVSYGVGDPSKTIVVPSGTWRIWPFSFESATSSKSTTTLVNPSNKVSSSAGVTDPIESTSKSNDTNSEVKHKIIKKKIRTITPTSAQLDSLGLKDGGNIITFTFSTAMLGKQQVDARIYLWKWNARVVISDVDGTITRSDLLGQVMPMVGYDWNHIGVAHLFSAIKENGYQLLFLSARSISQSHLTRRFLFNLKQDGKALPDGPVVISPDGLFPSLFREVIRRAPHEFKIACLEDIKALYPPDVSPFYAGFGNRDTDEISYLRVGIPEGKIFIINPKGEVAVHRRVDTNSYSDLHSLVDGMFPVVSSSEQEAFNSWNFWKLPPCTDYNI